MTGAPATVERPIVMSPESIRATRAGRKRQTRRLAKLPPAPEAAVRRETLTAGWPDNRRGDDAPAASVWHTSTGAIVVNRLGRPGDHLWTRERWRTWESAGRAGVRYAADDAFIPIERTREAAERWAAVHEHGRFGEAWRNPLFQPRWASRHLLEIAKVRAQRLQEITEQDAIAEGVVTGLIPADDYGPVRVGYVYGADDGRCVLYPTARAAYAIEWDRLNGKRATWASDPLVFATTFSILEAR